MKSTQGTTYRALQSQIARVNNTLEDLRLQTATGKKFNRASDNPAAIQPVFNARAQIRSSDRYMETMGTALDKMGMLDGQLDHVENVLASVKETAINGINGSLDHSDLASLAQQVAVMKAELLDTANARIDGKYIFAGYLEDTRPFTENASSPNSIDSHGDANATMLEIEPGQMIQTGLDGQSLFLGMEDADGDGYLEPEGIDMFELLTNVELALRGKGGQVVDASGDLLPDTSYYVDADGVRDFSIPILVDGTGTPVLDTNGDQIPLLQPDGQPVRLMQQVDIAGNPVFDGGTGKPVYLYSDGTVADVDAAGDPIFYDAVGDPHSLLDTSGNPYQLTLVPTIDEQLDVLDEASDQARSQRGLIGNNAYRVETAMDHMAGVKIDMVRILSRYEDVDLVEALTNLTQQESAFEAALKVTARVSNLSILNYL